MTGRDRRLARIAGGVVVLTCQLLLGSAPLGFATPTSVPEPSPPFGRVIYRAAKAAGFESLGVTMIACRHRDATPRKFAVQFYDDTGRSISFFGVPYSPPTPAGKKVVFVTDGMHFANHDVLDLRLGHLSIGTARVVSDARIVHCIGKIRMDGGAHSPSYRDEIGLVRDGEPLPHVERSWQGPPKRR